MTLDLNRLEFLNRAATPGPWLWQYRDMPWRVGAVTVGEVCEWSIRAEQEHPHPTIVQVCEADAEIIATLRTALPVILDRLR